MSLTQKLKKKLKQKTKKIRTPRLQKCPHKKGICQRVFVTTPKKPNSAQRKATKV
jgi:small subunit ribosomal protein S12